MKVRKLIWLTSLVFLGSMLSSVDLNHGAASANPVLRADGTGPVPPPPPPWTLGLGSSSTIA